MEKLQLKLTSPCTQQWSDIERADGVHYCDVCQKNILDLTTSTDAELLQFFKNKRENVCGRVSASQLNRELLIPSSKIKWRLLLPLTLSALVVSPVYAAHPEYVATPNDSCADSTLVLSAVSRKATFSEAAITGRAVDSLSGNPLSGVKIRKSGYENVLAITDTEGNFKLSIADEDKATIFIFDLIGYEKVETMITNKMVVMMNAERRIMLGGITTISKSQEPLYIIYADKKSCTISASKLSELSPNWINKIDVLKDAKATAIYGIKGANGVVLIEIKKAYVSKVDFSK
ncbi:hypothetical protein [Pedobacter glucosidilyticus]|uniref:hypothetical protein n=1 Tax=Pedobacter glucosidilyticus TaxID=1122941 RepID=UPI000429BFC0|nr:hypothetical protein [Pedobacter glucosidilyticus]